MFLAVYLALDNNFQWGMDAYSFDFFFLIILQISLNENLVSVVRTQFENYFLVDIKKKKIQVLKGGHAPSINFFMILYDGFYEKLVTSD